jgi:uncharacterized membrane protein YhhN
MAGEFALFAYLVFSAAVAAAIYWLVYCYRLASWKKTYIKTLSVALLALASVFAAGPWALSAALLTCAVGDFLLALDRDDAFLGGVVAFALGHLFYISVFLTSDFSEAARLLTGTRGAISIGLIVVAMCMGVTLFQRAGALRFAVLGYVPIIVAMGISALTLSPTAPLGLAIGGALIFVVSDFVLALEMFVLRADNVLRRGTPFVVWGTYWSAQAMLLVGLGFPPI